MNQKKMILVGEPTGQTSVWEQWANHCGYEIEYRTLEELALHGKDSPLIILDSYSLNEAPLPVYGKPLTRELLIIDEVRDAMGDFLVEEALKHRPFKPKKMPLLNRKRRSKGDRKGRKADRWR